MKLKAPAPIRRAHSQRKAAGTLAAGVVVPFRTTAERFLRWRASPLEKKKNKNPNKQTFSPPREITHHKLSHPEILAIVSDAVGQILASKERVAERRQSLEAESNPLRGRLLQTTELPGLPTPERRSKGHRPPTQIYQGRWPQEVDSAFARFVLESEILAEYSQRTTVNYDASGGGRNLTARMGGLGHVPEKIREIHTRYNWVRNHLSLRAIDTLDRTVLGMPHEATGAITTLSEMGNKLIPWIKDRASSKGITLGYLLHVGEVLDELYREYDNEIARRILY